MENRGRNETKRFIGDVESEVYRKEDYGPDYGCEEHPDDYVAMDKVILRDENGIEIDMAISDSTLYDKDINEGDWVYFDPNNQIFKEN